MAFVCLSLKLTLLSNSSLTSFLNGDNIIYGFFFPRKRITFNVWSMDLWFTCHFLVTRKTWCPHFSLLVLPADLLGHHSGVCRCSVPPGWHGTICIVQVELHKTALAVRYICCCSLYQFHNHHAAESCKHL